MEEAGVCEFVFDTETSGQKGVPLWHPQNRLLQVAIVQLDTGEWFNRKVKWEDGHYLTPENVAVHKITQQDLQENGEPPEKVARELLDWINERAKDRKILMIAHNAGFDYETLRKFLYTALHLSFGPSGADLNWAVFDTLPAVKDLHPELQVQYWPDERPHSLGKLATHFYELNTEGLHDAGRDVEVLCRIYKEKIKPRLTDCPTRTKYVLRLKESPRLLKLTELSGIGPARSFLISKKLNEAFAANRLHREEYEGMVVPPGLTTVAHLLVYGHLRWRQGIAQKNKLATQLTDSDDNQYWWICYHVECLLRETLQVHCDRLLGIVVSAVAGVDLLDLTTHTMREDGNLHFFPCCSGLPVAWLPMRLTQEECTRIKRENGWGTLNEMISDYITSRPSQREELLHSLNQCLDQKRTTKEMLDNIQMWIQRCT